MNRPIGATADGATVLRPGRHYRLVLVVTGATDTEALAAALAGAGLHGERLGISLPSDWQNERPPDWPEETLIGLTNQQSLIRVSGPCFTRGPVRIEPQTPIEPGASFRVVDAWDYGEAQGTPARVGQGAPAPAPDKAKQESSRTKKILFGAGAIAAIAVGWNWFATKRKEEREEQRLLKMTEKAERAELTEAVQRMTASGMTRAEALAQVNASHPACGCSHPFVEGLELEGERVPMYMRVR